MSDWRLKAYSAGIAAAEERLGRNVTGDEYMAIHVAIEALVDAVVLVPSATSEPNLGATFQAMRD